MEVLVKDREIGHAIFSGYTSYAYTSAPDIVASALYRKIAGTEAAMAESYDL